MTLSFDPDSLSLPIGHFIGDRLIPAKNGIDMHRPAGCPKADATLVDEAVQTAKAARRLQALRHWQGSRAGGLSCQPQEQKRPYRTVTGEAS
jgi:hypothetical protein